MNTDFSNPSLNIDISRLQIDLSEIDKIKNEDIGKLYIREHKGTNGVLFYQIASTDHPIWCCIKHFFITLFSMYKYNYESGQNALQKIKGDPAILNAFNEELARDASHIAKKLKIENVQTEKYSPNDLRVCFGVIGYIALGILKGEPISRNTAIKASIGVFLGSVTGGALGVMIGTEIGNGILDSIIKTIWGGFIGVLIGSLGGEVAVIGWRPLAWPIVGLAGGVIIAEIGLRIASIVDRIFVHWLAAICMAHCGFGRRGNHR